MKYISYNTQNLINNLSPQLLVISDRLNILVHYGKNTANLSGIIGGFFESFTVSIKVTDKDLDLMPNYFSLFYKGFTSVLALPQRKCQNVW